MELEITRLIYYYSFGREEECDKEFIDQLITIIKRYKKLGEYVTDIRFLPKGESDEALARYDIIHKKIEVFTGTIANAVSEFKWLSLNKMNELEKKACRYFIIANTIIHEMEHASQRKALDDNDQSLDHTLIKLDMGSRFDLIASNPNNTDMLKNFVSYIKHAFYTEYHDMVPTERMAEFYSFKTLLNTLLNKQEFPFLFAYYCCSCFNVLTSCYDFATKNDTTCPTHFFLTRNFQDNDWKQLPFYSSDKNQLLAAAQNKYDLVYRLSRGLPASKEEIHGINPIDIIQYKI